MRDTLHRLPCAGKGKQAQGAVRGGDQQDGLRGQVAMLWVWVRHLLCASVDDAQACMGNPVVCPVLWATLHKSWKCCRYAGCTYK